MTLVGLIACGSAKLSEKAPAGLLYVGGQFKVSRAYVERFCDRWYILSAKYGVLDPSREIEPYAITLKTMTAQGVENWSRVVARQLVRVVEPTEVLVCLAGKLYGGFTRYVPNPVEWPCDVLPDARFGYRMQWLQQQLKGSQQ